MDLWHRLRPLEVPCFDVPSESHNKQARSRLGDAEVHGVEDLVMDIVRLLTLVLDAPELHHHLVEHLSFLHTLESFDVFKHEGVRERPFDIVNEGVDYLSSIVSFSSFLSKLREWLAWETSDVEIHVMIALGRPFAGIAPYRFDFDIGSEGLYVSQHVVPQEVSGLFVFF